MTQGWRQNAWVLPVSAVMVTVMIIALPQHLTFPPPRELNANFPGLDFGLSVAHILLATVALVTLCVNIWPWLRKRSPAAHRWSGRVYTFTALSASLLTLPLVLLNTRWQGDLGAIGTGGFWFVTTLIGYVAIRRGNERMHRRWMLYSFAMGTSFAWGVILGPFFTEPAQLPYVVELIRWVGPLVNLGAAKLWLDYTDRRDAKTIPFPTARARLRVATTAHPAAGSDEDAIAA